MKKSADRFGLQVRKERHTCSHIPLPRLAIKLPQALEMPDETSRTGLLSGGRPGGVVNLRHCGCSKTLRPMANPLNRKDNWSVTQGVLGAGLSLEETLLEDLSHDGSPYQTCSSDCRGLWLEAQSGRGRHLS